MIGKILEGRYRVVERIGGGGMALVYRAEDLQLGRDVALKLLRGQFGNDEDFIRRFRREATSAASLSHPNVVQIFDVGQEEDLYYIVMELVEGKTLKALITEQGPLTVLEACRIADDILSALDHAHQHRIVHRDIKPHNILIARDGRVKVTDFGIARATTADTVTHTGSMIGSAHYFSPEQANGQPTGEKSDIYSVGIVLYEMVTGVVPFQGESPITVALKHIREPAMPPSRLNGEVPLELEGAILQALEKEPDDRYASAEEMRKALAEFMAAHRAGITHMPSGDFPTMDLRAVRRVKGRPLEEEEEAVPRVRAGRRPEQPRRRSYGWLWALLIALILVGGVGSGVWAFVRFLDVPVVVVPDVTGLSLGKAQEGLAQLQLGNQVQAEQYSDLPVNHVISMEPPPGTSVKIRRTIDLVISKGQNEKQVPNVLRRGEDEARIELENAGFKIGQVTSKHDQEPEGRVIDMTPPPRTMLPAGSPVDLVVSLGPLRVPKIYGETVQNARRILLAAGLNVGKVEPMPHPTKPKDTVLASDPQEGIPVAPGQAITLYVAEGAAAQSKPFEKTITVSGDPNRFHDVAIVLVEVVDNIPTETPQYNGKQKGGEKITVKGTFRGDAHLQVRTDGKIDRIDLP
jgi:beta-lactam-binding protein with PASTA domain